jgi:mRNA interferase MazF
MGKNFSLWFTRKANLDENDGTALFKEREVWWCSLGKNIGFEQDGVGDLFTRPVVILKKFNVHTCLIIPLTSQEKVGKYYFSIGVINGVSNIAILSQIRFIDRKRLVRKLAKLEAETFKNLYNATQNACFPEI